MFMHICTCGYPITELPLSMCHPDGAKLDTPKNKILQVLEPMQNEVSGNHNSVVADCTLIDGGLLIHSKLSTEYRQENK